MTEANLTTSVRQPNARVSILDIRGDISAAAEPLLRAAYGEASTPTTRAILRNCTNLEYMDSSGIGLLVKLLVRAQRQRQQILAYGLSAHYTRIFALTRIDEAIRIYA